MFGKYKVAHLLGKTRGNEKRFREVETALTKTGFICFAPVIYDFDVYVEYVELLTDMCYEKLLACDFCVLVTPEHIGQSTTQRIEQSIYLGKKVFVWEDGRLGRCFDNATEFEQFKYKMRESKPYYQFSNSPI